MQACPPGSFLLRGNDDDDDVIVSYVAMQPSAEVGVMHAPLTESSDGSWSLPDKYWLCHALFCSPSHDGLVCYRPSFTALAMLWRFCSDDFKFGYVGTADPPFLQALYIDDLPVAPQPLAIERGKSTPTPSVAPTPAPGGAITPNTVSNSDYHALQRILSTRFFFVSLSRFRMRLMPTACLLRDRPLERFFSIKSLRFPYSKTSLRLQTRPPLLHLAPFPPF